MTTPNERIPPPPSRPLGRLFLISFVLLFFELACIRWFGSTVVFLTFFTNIVLLATFLGMSVGLLAASGRRDWTGATAPLLLAAVLLAHGTLWAYSRFGNVLVDVGGQGSPQQVYFGTEYRAGDAASVQKIREHGDVGARESTTVGDLSDGMARPEAEIPETREERLEDALVALQRAGLDQHEEIDVRMRKQRAAAESADREQRGIGRIADAGAENVNDDVLDGLRADARQRVGIGAGAERIGEPALVVSEKLPQREPRLGRDAAPRHRGRQARRFGKARSLVCARHRFGSSLRPLSARASGSRSRRR